jgi:hypothetical protein
MMDGDRAPPALGRTDRIVKERSMKRTFLVLAIVALALGTGFAQPGPGAIAGQQSAPAIVKVEGKLALVNGLPGIQTKDKTYYVHIPAWFYGFVDTLKEGASVKVEGYEMALPQAPAYSNLLVTKISVGGKDYDLSNAMGTGLRQGARGGMMGGRRSQGRSGGGGMMGGRGMGW